MKILFHDSIKVEDEDILINLDEQTQLTNDTSEDTNPLSIRQKITVINLSVRSRACTLQGYKRLRAVPDIELILG